VVTSSEAREGGGGRPFPPEGRVTGRVFPDFMREEDVPEFLGGGTDFPDLTIPVESPSVRGSDVDARRGAVIVMLFDVSFVDDIIDEDAGCAVCPEIPSRRTTCCEEVE